MVGLIVYSDVASEHQEGNHYFAVNHPMQSAPSYRGTGLEDDFNLPWSAYLPGTNPRRWSHAFHGGLYQARKGVLSLYRFFVLDPIEFVSGIRYWISQVENNHPTESECREQFKHYSTVAFYYADIGGNGIGLQTSLVHTGSVDANDLVDRSIIGGANATQYNVTSTFVSSLNRQPSTWPVAAFHGPCEFRIKLRLRVPNMGATLRRVFDAGAKPLGPAKKAASGASPLQHARIAVGNTSLGWWRSPNGYNPMERLEEDALPIPSALTQHGHLSLHVKVPAGVLWTAAELSLHALLAAGQGADEASIK